MQYFFAHDQIRTEQQLLADTIHNAVENNKHVLAHAPTGLGKTAAALAPCVTYALKNKKTVFFLTSRFTQHAIVLETLKKMQAMHHLSFGITDLVAKKWMCLVPGATMLSSGEFITYCKKQREQGLCEFYENTRKKGGETTVDTQVAVKELGSRILDVQTLKENCGTRTLCPYEISIELAKNATVIIGDYNYIFNRKIQENFFAKTSKQLSDCIVIVDEGHNLPERVKEMATARLTTNILQHATKEAELFGLLKVRDMIRCIHQMLETFIDIEAPEQLVTMDWLESGVEEQFDYDLVLEALSKAQEEVYKKQQRSYISSVHDFMNAWRGEDEGFTRIISKGIINSQPAVILSYRCLDPNVITSRILEHAHSVILMSGTLSPIPFYRDVLGFPREKTQELTFENPFPKHNALHLIVPKTTTKYNERSEDQFKEIAAICSDIVNQVKGNCAVFFPSYQILKHVNAYFMNSCKKTTFIEYTGMAKDERVEMLERFKSYKDVGAVLLGASTGSFGEGIDLPGDLLKCVIVVGLPLPKPDLETNQLIKYYDHRFSKGWEYGYIFPAFNKTLQNAGRCIRSKDDTGVIVYLDKRFVWPQYKNCFPHDINLQVNLNYKQAIESFLK